MDFNGNNVAKGGQINTNSFFAKGCFLFSFTVQLYDLLKNSFHFSILMYTVIPNTDVQYPSTAV